VVVIVNVESPVKECLNLSLFHTVRKLGDLLFGPPSMWYNWGAEMFF